MKDANIKMVQIETGESASYIATVGQKPHVEQQRPTNLLLWSDSYDKDGQ